MKKRTCRVLAIASLFLGVVGLLCGCATVPKEADLKESLKSTATTYWKMRMEGKFEEILKMEDEEALEKGDRGGLPLDKYYKSRAKVAENVQSYTIKDVQLQEYKGRVDVEFTFFIPQISQPFRQVLTDEWVFKKGEWRHILPQK